MVLHGLEITSTPSHSLASFQVVIWQNSAVTDTNWLSTESLLCVHLRAFLRWSVALFAVLVDALEIDCVGEWEGEQCLEWTLVFRGLVQKIVVLVAVRPFQIGNR